MTILTQTVTFPRDVNTPLRPFVKGYLKKQQTRYIADLRRALEEE